jgi:hypothetical protein
VGRKKQNREIQYQKTRCPAACYGLHDTSNYPARKLAIGVGISKKRSDKDPPHSSFCVAITKGDWVRQAPTVYRLRSHSVDELRFHDGRDPFRCCHLLQFHVQRPHHNANDGAPVFSGSHSSGRLTDRFRFCVMQTGPTGSPAPIALLLQVGQAMMTHVVRSGQNPVPRFHRTRNVIPSSPPLNRRYI